MPTFDFTSPEGKSYSVEGPEGATSEQAFQILQQHLGTAPATFAERFPASSEPSMAEDAAKSVGAGLGNATIWTLGALGDLRSLASHGVDALGSKLGVDLSPVKKIASMTPLGSIAGIAPTSEQVRSTVTDPIVSPDYEPKYAFNNFLKTGAEMLPAMADPELAGPNALKAASKLFLSRVAAPAAVSETAGELTKGTEAEPYARIGGALLAGAGASKMINAASEARALKAATPALDNLKASTSADYDALTSRNVATPIAQSTLDNLADDITKTLNNKGIRPSNADSIHRAVDEIRAPATAGNADVADLVAARQSIKELLGKQDTNKAGAFVALGKIEKAIEQNSPNTMAKLKEADANWSAVKANEALDKRLARAELRAAGEHSGMNIGNKIRQQVTNYLMSSEARYLSPETKADLQKIVKGTASQNLVRHVSNLLGGGGGLGMLIGGAAGYEADGLKGAFAGAAAGRTLKIANNRSVLKQAERAAEAIRRRSPMGKATPLILPPPTSTALGALLPAALARPQQ